MPLILGTNSIKDTGYNVANSLRFNDGSSDSLTKSFSGSGNRRTWTLSVWFKLGLIPPASRLFSIGNDASSDILSIFFTSGDLRFENDESGSKTFEFRTDQVFRDPSAWSHLVFAVDTTQSTSSNRVKIYHNGSQITSFSTENYPSQNSDTLWNHTTGSATIGARAASSSGTFFDGYMAEIVSIDGQQLDPTSFGEFDSDSPTIWKPKDVSGLTFGTNGFHLDFENASSLGADVSGNSNNFTVNNLTSIDQTTDTCTNNFATMNPLDERFGFYTFSEGNCQVVSSSSGNAYVSSTIAVSKGKWYFETKITSQPADERFLIGIAPRGAVEDNHPDSTNNGGINLSGFNAVINSQGSSVLNNFFGNNTTRFDGFTGIIGMALDLTDGSEKITFSKDGAWVTGSGTTDTDFSNALQVDISAKMNESTASGYWHLVVGEGSGSSAGTFQINFGNPPFSISSGNSDAEGFGNFEFPVPSGYFSLCTKNLAEYG